MLGGGWGGRQELESQEGRRCWNLEDAIKKKERTGGDFHLLDCMGSSALLL